MAEVWQSSLRKFVDSLTDEQVLLLGGEFDQEKEHAVVRLEDLLLQKFRSWDDEKRSQVAASCRKQFFDRVR